MGSYLDRLQAEFDEITASNTEILERAADAGREVDAEEQKIIERADSRRDELQKAIEYYADREKREEKVSTLRSRVPAAPSVTRTGTPPPPEYDIHREYPTIGHYAIDVHRATVLKDKDAAERIHRALEEVQRATQHQTTADNPGLIPTPILGPVVNLFDSSRPFINAITTRPLPAGKFDRPTITQHVAVGKQAAEKTLTESQKMIIGNLPVTAATYAGHVNVSRQDIKWTSPAILSILFDDFADVYADETCADACAQFLASLNPANTVDVATPDAAGIQAAMFGAAAAGLGRTGQFPTAQFVSVDVWSQLGGLVSTATGTPVYPSLSLSSSAGNPAGLPMVVDPHFPDGTWVLGPAKLAEWYEDIDGLLQVGEPDVIGQLVGYAGYGAFINIAPDAFTTLTPPPVIP